MYVHLSLTLSFLPFSIYEGMEVGGSVLAGNQWYLFFLLFIFGSFSVTYGLLLQFLGCGSAFHG